MNKGVNQLELVPAAPAEPATDPLSSLPPEAKAIVEKALAEADDFDWNHGDDSIVVPPRPGIAVYLNKFDDIVIRTQNTAGDEDHFAYVRPEALSAVIKALKECLT